MRTFDRLDDDELERYVDANAQAVRDVAALADIEAGFANHVLMGPAIMARGLGERPYAVKIHGSALEYTLKPNYKRFAPYASEGLVPAKAVLVGSRHTAESLWAAMPLEGLRERTFLGPPGVDVHTFVPRDKASATNELDALVRWLDSAERTGFSPAAAAEIDALCHPRRDKPPDAEELAAVRAGYDVTGIDLAAPDGLAALDPARADRLLRRQADRVEGRRPAARGVAARACARAAREARGGRLRDLPRGTRGAAARARACGRAAADARLPPGPRARRRSARPAHLPAHASSRSIAGRHERYFAAAKKMRESDRVHRPPRPRRACAAAAERRGDHRAEHVPGGVRHGRGGGERPAACCRSAPRIRAWPR